MAETYETSEWFLFLGGIDQVSAFDVYLGPQRSQILSVKLRESGSRAARTLKLEKHLEGRPTSTTAASAELDLAVGAGLVALLSIEYFGDTPQVLAGAWASDERRTKDVVSLAVPFSMLQVGAFFQAGADEKVIRLLVEQLLRQHAVHIEVVSQTQRKRLRKAYLRESRDVFELRRKALEDDRRVQQFFYRLDVGSASNRLQKDWLRAMQATNSRLATRVRARSILAGPRGDDRVPIFPRSQRFQRVLPVASLFVQTLVVTHLYDVDEDLVAWAFEQFALDRLAVSDSNPVAHSLLLAHGAPNGAAFFRFAELAFACIEYGIHKGFWTRHLQTFVLTAHLYAEHGGKLDAQGRRIYGYEEGRRFPRQRRNTLTRYYAAKGADLATLEDHFTSIAGQAVQATGSPLAGSRKLPKPAPFTPQDTSPREDSPLNSLLGQTNFVDLLNRMSTKIMSKIS